MSIEKSGPQGYEYQYLVSILFVLKTIVEDEIEVYIEKKNGEDVQIIFLKDEEKKIIDIQVKKRANQIEISEFAEWISHFEERSSTNNLITKLSDNINRYVVFVTNSRCKDDVSEFVNSDKFYEPLGIDLNKDKLAKITDEVIKNYAKKTKLNVERKKFYIDFFKELTNKKLKSILNRMIVWDRHDVNYIEQLVKIILKKDYYIPENKLDNVIGEILDIVKYGRNKEVDISTMIIKILKTFKGDRIFKDDERYLKRDEIEACLQLIESKNVLLLTGLSLCGKTYIAKNIAQILQEKGYNVKETYDLFSEMGAIHFLSHSSTEERVCILEDPFGHSIANDNSIELVSGLRKLIRNLPSHRKLIVTTRKDILIHVMNKDNVTECKIKDNEWMDITLYNEETAFKIWKKYFSDTQKSIEVFKDISKWLKINENCEFLQPGQIAQLYYSVQDFSEISNMKIESIIREARTDSQELADKISKRGEICQILMIVLGLGASTINCIKIDDLAYVLENSNETPSILLEKKEWKVISYSSANLKKHLEFPKYDEEYNLSDKYKKELKYLYKYRYISIDNINKTILFTHPIYHQSSKILFKDFFNSIFDNEKMIQLSQKSLGALSKETSLNTLRILEKIYLEDKNKKIKEVILKGLYSIFPSVKDRVISFFDKRINELSEEEQKELVKSLNQYESVRNNGILWFGEEPWYNPSQEREFPSIFFSEKKSNNENISLTEEVTPKQMWGLITNGAEIFCSNNEKILIKAMDFHESFIREEAIYKLFKSYAFKYKNIERFLNKHEHPNVIFKLFKGALQSWNKYDSSKKFKITEFIKKSFTIMSVAMRFKSFLENFEDAHYRDSIKLEGFSKEEKIELWGVWCELIVELLEKFPSKYDSINQPHLNNVIESSLEFIKDSNKITNIANVWCGWLDNDSICNTPDDYGMSVMSYLIRGTERNYTNRTNLILKALKTKTTSFITSHIYHLIENWSLLNENEKVLIEKLLNSNRTDVKWIKAVALNCIKVPERIQNIILGERLLEKSSSEIVKKMDDKLLECCLNVYCGYPQPLWFNGYHHLNRGLWDEIIIAILKYKKDKSFDIALRELLDSLYNKEQSRFKNGYELWADINRNASKDTKDKLFYRLINLTITQNQSNKRVWDIFMENCNENELNDYFDEIVKNIEGIQYYQVIYKDLYELFDNTVIYDEIIPRIKVDWEILKICNLFLKKSKIQQGILDGIELDLKSNSNKVFISIIKDKFLNTPPRLSLINKKVLNTMNKLGVKNKELKTIIEKNRRRLIDIGYSVVSEFSYNDCYDLDNWNSKIEKIK